MDVNMKEDYLRFEEEFLSKYAKKSVDTKGRAIQIEPCSLRTEFQRDRDRILHSKSFRRLKHKTQVFLSPGGDHYRTRLTHTLEVTQIARTISRALCLNEDLTEAISLGHDLGHTPFGHAGERVLRAKTGHFEHNEQSLRVVDIIEKLNLTYEVRDGILNHRLGQTPITLEGRVVSISDRIAYLTHDIEDAVRAGILKEEDIPSNIEDILGKGKGKKIDTLVKDVITASYGKNDITLSETVGLEMGKLREFMFNEVYGSVIAKKEEKKAVRMLGILFDYFYAHPEDIPALYKNISDDPIVNIKDYIAGMSDNYAEKVFSSHFIPKGWEDQL
jgi:dGTPase